MSEIKKKPPMKISDLEKTSRPVREPGALSYVTGSESKEPIQESLKKKGKFFSPETKKFLLPIVVSMVFSVFIVSQMAPSKSDFNILVRMVNANSAAVTALETSSKALAAKMETLITSSAQYAKKTDSPIVADNTTATDKRIKALDSRISSQSQTLAALSSSIKDLSNKPASLPVQNTITQVVSSGVDAILTGTVPNFQLTATGKTGVYYAKVTLVPTSKRFLSSSTDYQGAVNAYYTFLGGGYSRGYSPEMFYDSPSSGWVLSSISFITTPLQLDSKAPRVFSITITNTLNSLGSFNAYIEILPSTASSGSTGGDI